MSPARKPDVCEGHIRKALRHLKRAYDLVACLEDLTADDVGSVVVQEDIKAAFYSVKEYAECQFNVVIRRRPSRRA
jgi:hypothetical protein